MRLLALSIWIFINLILFSMCGYMYVLWSQYSEDADDKHSTSTYSYDQQIFLYNRGYPPGSYNDTRVAEILLAETRQRHSIIKNSLPRFPKLYESEAAFDSVKYRCMPNDTSKECDRKTVDFKESLVKELKRVFLEESNANSKNRYNVKYGGERGNYMDKSSNELLCELKNVVFKTVRKGDLLPKVVLRNYMPVRELFEIDRFNSCAIVSSAGSLKGSQLGYFIDSHNLIVRFNHAPTQTYEEDVGAKTTFRILNSQVIVKDEFEFLRSDLYKNVTLLVWDPSKYTQSLQQWLDHPEHDFFGRFMEFRRLHIPTKFYILNPQSLWDLWEFLQRNSPSQLRRNPPSSGFLGLALLLHHCNYVDMFEYIPSTRLTRKCHYFDDENNPACTFGVWHPLAAEKLITYSMNIADDKTVFQNGFIRIPGFANINC